MLKDVALGFPVLIEKAPLSAERMTLSSTDCFTVTLSELVSLSSAVTIPSEKAKHIFLRYQPL